MDPIRLAGNEAASFEKLVGALLKGAEAADNRHRVQLRKWLLDATEGATEIGVWMADGRWANIALALDGVRKLVETMDYGLIMHCGPEIADNLRQLHQGTVMLRHGRTRH